MVDNNSLSKEMDNVFKIDKDEQPESFITIRDDLSEKKLNENPKIIVNKSDKNVVIKKNKKKNNAIIKINKKNPFQDIYLKNISIRKKLIKKMENKKKFIHIK